jgi:hypothetical protein
MSFPDYEGKDYYESDHDEPSDTKETVPSEDKTTGQSSCRSYPTNAMQSMARLK